MITSTLGSKRLQTFRELQLYLIALFFSPTPVYCTSEDMATCPLPSETPQPHITLPEPEPQDESHRNPLSLPLDGAENAHLHRTAHFDRQMDIASLGTAPPRVSGQNFSTVRRAFIRQILGLNPFKTSYFALYKPLDDWESRIILLGGVLLAIAAGIPLPLIGVIFGKIINNFPPSEDELRVRLGQLMGVAVAFFVVTWGWSVCWGVVGERVSRRMRESLVERALGMEPAFFDTESPDLTGTLTEKTQTIQLGTSEKVGLFIASISYFVAAFTVGFTLNARLTGIMLASVIPAMGLIVYLGTKFVSKYSKEAATYVEEASAVAESALRAVQVVQAFGVSEELAQSHIKFLRSALRQGIKKSMAGAVMLGSVFFVAYAANGLAFWEGHRQRQGVGEQLAEAGTIYAVVFLILDASFVVGQFGPFIQTFALAAAAGQSVFSILNHPKSQIDVYSKEGKQVDRKDFEKDVQLQDVSFVYPARPTSRVLNGVNIRFQAGKVTGVVGPSGSGKSTVAALLLRFYDPTAGRITLGDDDLRSINIASLRSNIALVTQHPTLFTGTILENIMYGIPDRERMSEEQVIERCTAAARDACCDFLEYLPNGIHTKVGGGHHSQLSGGQKQRICLARALAGDPSLLLLDEYTSAMDATSEAAVLGALKRSSAISGRTTIIIAHRLATVKDADRILVMKDGAVIEEGNHDSLIRSQGVYAELIRAQQFERKESPSTTSSSIMSSNKSISADELKEELQDHQNTAPSSKVDQAEHKSSTELIRRCLSLSRPEFPLILFGIVASILSGGVIVGEAVVFGNLIELLNQTIGSNELNSQVALFCLLFFILSLVALFAHACSGGAFGIVSENLVLRVRDISFRTILSQDIGWFSKPGHSHHTLMSKMTMDSGHISGLSGVILGTIFSVMTSMLGGIIVAHVFAWKIAVVLLSAVPVMLVAGFFRLRILAKAEERHQTAYNGAAALASEAVAAIQTVAALGREHDVLRLYRKEIQTPYEQSLKFTVWGNILLAFSLSVTYFVYALAYWWGAQQVRNGNYTQKQFFIVLPALLFSAQAAGQMFSLAPEITRAKSAARSVFALHDERPSIICDVTTTPSSSDVSEKSIPEKSSHVESSPERRSNKGQLEFRDVSLYYESRPHVPALNRVSLSIRAGEYVAFVGRSGAGKSSCIALIERFFDPSSGNVLLDGHDIRSQPVQEHRARLALVEQEPDLFPGSIKFNICLGARPGAQVELEDVINVSKKCGLHDFIMGLPEGYNTECGAHGSRFSGGQRQRLAIARALIRDPEILLLDEATSQLDANTEKEVRIAIAAASSGRTTIMIAHRLASVQHADRIFVFEGGKIVEEGKHEELVAMGGIYSGMVAAQELS